ncbi:hypothetical protein VP01_1633g6 [Puccinia sorghi]|uniref:Uncharacterized protein n=1 Tax=Puccinia sorghi TaxID=27349 RepID=A0A0L6VGS8_9BASI|nr:hypothetical protein VP01_1633g6 [Puccinia sorghi]
MSESSFTSSPYLSTTSDHASTNSLAFKPYQPITPPFLFFQMCTIKELGCVIRSNLEVTLPSNNVIENLSTLANSHPASTMPMLHITSAEYITILDALATLCDQNSLFELLCNFSTKWKSRVQCRRTCYEKNSGLRHHFQIIQDLAL